MSTRLSVILAVTAGRGDTEFRRSIDSLEIDAKVIKEHRQLLFTSSGGPEDVTSLWIRSREANSASLEEHVASLREQVGVGHGESELKKLGIKHRTVLSCYLAYDEAYPPLFLPVDQVQWLASLNCSLDLDINRYSSESG
jgi:hypothetical protein